MDEKIIELAKKLVEKRLASNYEEALILAEKFTKIDMKYDYDNSFIEEKNTEKNSEDLKKEKKNETSETTYIAGESSEENLKNAIEGIKTIKLYENIKIVKKNRGFHNTRELLGETSISKSINQRLENLEKKEKPEVINTNKKIEEHKISEDKNTIEQPEDPKKKLYNSVDINSFFNVNNLKGKEIPKKK